jgi:hypothetical protein
MIFEELIEPSPADTARLIAQQERDREARNAEALLRWHLAAFGPVAGPQLAAGTMLRAVPLTASEIRYRNARNGYDVMHSVACIGIDEAITNSRRVKCSK